MSRILFIQAVVILLAILASAIFVGRNGAVSAGLGGLACYIPNVLFALRMNIVARRKDASYLANFFVGEFFKVLATIAFVLLVARAFPDLHWPSMLIGLGLSLHAFFFGFWIKN